MVIKLLQEDGLLHSRVGQGVLSILLAQDLAIIPMLIVLGLLSAGDVDIGHLSKQGVGAILFIVLFLFVVYRKKFKLPLSKWLKEDKELQLFAALSICFGLALLSAWFDLSTALGAFIAGVVIGTAKETHWVHNTLESLKVLFVALFFVSIGMLLDFDFLRSHLWQVFLLAIAALLSNTFINAIVLKVAEYSWKDCLFAGLLLSQIGEFSFVLAAVGAQSKIINSYGYQLALSVISLSLLLSPLWINLGKRFINRKPAAENT